MAEARCSKRSFPTATDAVNSALSHSASGGTLAVQDFTFPISPPSNSLLTVGANSSGAWTLTPQGLNNFNQPVSLAQTQFFQPPGTNISPCNLPLVYPATVLPGQTAQATVSTGAVPGTQICGITMKGTYGGVSHFATSYLELTPNLNFTLPPQGTQTTTAGGSAQFTLGYLPIANFSGTVGFSVAGLPPGASYTPLSLSAGQMSGILTVSVPAGVLATTYPLTITAVSPAGCAGSCTTNQESPG